MTSKIRTKMTSKIRTEVNASIRKGIHNWTNPVQRAGPLQLLEKPENDGTTLLTQLNPPRGRPSRTSETWPSACNERTRSATHRRRWNPRPPKRPPTSPEDTDASEPQDHTLPKQVALIARLTHKAKMPVRDNPATMQVIRSSKEVVSRGKFRELLVAGQGGGHGQASALPVVADHVRDLETTSSPWQAHAA
jgi:hypothetical protein